MNEINKIKTEVNLAGNYNRIAIIAGTSTCHMALRNYITKKINKITAKSLVFFMEYPLNLINA